MIVTRIEEATTLEDIQYLWKTDDADWLKQRKEEWSYLKEHKFSDSSAKDLKLNSRYFIYGDVDEYINPYLRYFLTPFKSPEEAIKAFNLNRFLFDGQALIFDSYVFRASKDGGELTWVKSQISYFVLAVLGGNFNSIKAKVKFNPSAGYWCSQYMSTSKRYLLDDSPFSGVEVCIDFFLSALTYSDDHKKCLMIIGKEKEKEKLFEAVDKYLSKPNKNESKYNFAEALFNKKEEILSKIEQASMKS